jgi:hypothetical protein
MGELMSRIGLARLGSAVAVGVLVAGAFAAPAFAAGGTVQGIFTTNTGTPIDGASVTAYSADGNWLQDATTNSAGSYRLTGVTAGGVQLEFNNNGLEHWSPGVLDQEHAMTYTLAAGGTLTVNETQPATGTIVGHFTDASGEPVPYANVTVKNVDTWTWLDGYTDDQGNYSVGACRAGTRSPSHGTASSSGPSRPPLRTPLRSSPSRPARPPRWTTTSSRPARWAAT